MCAWVNGFFQVELLYCRLLIVNFDAKPFITRLRTFKEKRSKFNLLRKKKSFGVVSGRKNQNPVSVRRSNKIYWYEVIIERFGAKIMFFFFNFLHNPPPSPFLYFSVFLSCLYVRNDNLYYIFPFPVIYFYYL